MPLERLVLILAAVLAAAGLTVWIAATATAAGTVPSWTSLSVVALVLVPLVAMSAGRVVVGRVRAMRDDPHGRVRR